MLSRNVTFTAFSVQSNAISAVHGLYNNLRDCREYIVGDETWSRGLGFH